MHRTVAQGKHGDIGFVITRIKPHHYSYAFFAGNDTVCGTFRDDRVDCAKEMAKLIESEGAHFFSKEI